MNQDDTEDRALHDAARRLGERAAARLDVERTAQAVLARLRTEPARRPAIGWPAPWLRIAAAVVLILGAAVALRHVGRRSESVRPEVVATGAGGAGGAGGVSLNDLSADELREVLSALDQATERDPVGSADAGLEDLTAPELRRLLRALEG